MKNNKIFTIPNILSFFRIMLAPFILWTYFIEQYYVSAGLLVLSGITDIADGFIARHFNMISALGKALDPIADKLTVLTVIIGLCFASKLMIILLSLFIVKEFIMGIQGLIIIKKTGTTYSAQWHGKLATFTLYLTIFINIVWVDMPKTAILIFIGLCSVAVILSLTLYTIRNIKTIKEIKNKKCIDTGETKDYVTE